MPVVAVVAGRWRKTLFFLMLSTLPNAGPRLPFLSPATSFGRAVHSRLPHLCRPSRWRSTRARVYPPPPSLLVPNRGLHRYAETAANFPLAAKTGGPTLGPQAGSVGWSTPTLGNSWRTRRGQPTVQSSPSRWRVASSLYKRTTLFDHTSNSFPLTPTTTDLISDASARHGRNTRHSGRACVTRAPAASTLSARARPHAARGRHLRRPPQLCSFRLPDKGTAPGRGGGFILPGSTLSMTTRAGLGNYVWRSCAAALA